MSKPHPNSLKNLRHKYPGEQNGHNKLTAEQVQKIRRQLLRGANQCHLAKYYDVSKYAINHIAKNRTWLHLPWPKLDRTSTSAIFDAYTLGVAETFAKVNRISTPFRP